MTTLNLTGVIYAHQADLIDVTQFRDSYRRELSAGSTTVTARIAGSDFTWNCHNPPPPIGATVAVEINWEDKPA